jgi:aspartate/methionine/tyrosine aminotransferase
MLVDVSPLGMDGATASSRLLERGKVAATPMINWGGDRCANYVRLVYSNESTERLAGIGDRFRTAFG